MPASAYARFIITNYLKLHRKKISYFSYVQDFFHTIISASAGTLAMDYLQVSHLFIMVNSAAGIPWGVSGMARFSIQGVN